MTDSASIRAISGRSDQQPLPLKRAEVGTVPAGDSLRFADVLHVDRNGEGFSSEQMLEANQQSPQGGRSAYMRAQYKDAVRASARKRTEARTGVKARSNSIEASEAATPQHSVPAAPMEQAVRVSEVTKTNATKAFTSPPTEGDTNLQALSRFLSQSSNRHDAERASTSPDHRSTPQSGTLPSAAAMNNLNHSGVASIGDPAQELARMLAAANPAKAGLDSSSTQIQALARPDSVSQGSATGASRPNRPDAAPRTTTTSHAKQAESAQSSTFDRLLRSFRMQPGRQSTARVLLDPPDLGRVHVQVSVAGDRVEIGVQTEREEARQLVSQRAAKLKSALEQQGMIVDRFDIVTNSSGLFDPRAMTAGENTPGRLDHGGDGSGREIRSRSREKNDQHAKSIREYADHLSEMGFDIQV